jgi:DNA mismatch repair protein mutS
MNQGYFLELTSKDSELFEEFLAQQDFTALSPQEQEKFAIVRRQTLKGNQRYTSPYLDNLQSHILGAKEQLKTKESEVLQGLQQSLLENITPLYSLAEKLAWLDLFTSRAFFAKEYRLVKPQLAENGIIEIQAGRHLVIEAFLPKDQPFIPNALAIGESKSTHHGLIHIIT